MIFTLPHFVAGIMVLAITAYVLLGGADFGGGLWDLVARGERRDQQRKLIANALGPVWEANHVWLILVVVLLFGCFPVAFAHISTELHVPLTLMLVGVVLRGSAFTFRSYDTRGSSRHWKWGLVFSIASLFTPFILGVCIGTLAAGNIPMSVAPANVTFVTRFVLPWTAPFPLSVGLLTLALCALLAATYLTVEAKDELLKRDFRARALASCVALALAAALAGLLAQRDAPLVFNALTTGARAATLLAASSLLALTLAYFLWREKFLAARAAAQGLTACIIWGWAWAQYPIMLPPDRTIQSLAAPRSTLEWTMGILVVGTAILLPSFAYLFLTFKGNTPFDHDE